MKSILRVDSIDENYKIDINVYPSIVTDTKEASDMLIYGTEELDDMPQLDRISYLPFNPFN